MRRLVAIVLAGLACLPAHAQQPTAAQWCYQYLLATWTPQETLTPVIEGIVADRTPQNAFALDNVAQFVLDHLDDEGLSKDVAKELVGVLSRTRSGRYRLVMARIRETKLPKVLRDMARDYVVEHRRKTVDEYVPGSMKLTSLPAGYVQAALSVHPTDERARSLDSLKKLSTLDELFSLMGPPQHVAARYIRVSETFRFSRLILYYRGAGNAVVGLDDQGAWLFQSAGVDPLAFESLMPYRTRAAEFGLPDDAAIRMAQLSSARLPAMRVVLEDSYNLTQVPVEFLDTAAEILAQNWRTPRDEVAEDVYAWIIRLLTIKGGPRYSPLLTQIAEETKSLKLRKWARLTVQKPAGIPRARYVVGSIVLAEEARKFPSPYPGVTYTNGRL